jgi:exodeoxyribonuclease VII large subunit
MEISTNLLTKVPNAIQEYSVSEISSKLKLLIEQNFGYVKVRGEISGLKIATSGHGYFSLKDNDSVLACICWKYAIAKLKFKPEDGIQVVATGKLTIYPGQSKYQLSVESLEADGLGALIVMLEKRKAMFQAEGLFDESRKKKLPFFPQRIGVVTSLSGAVIRDIMHRIADRCPTHVIIWPVLVQGETAADEIAKAIIGFNNISSELKPDLLIIARGGGSIEDLWAFNEEIVVRAAATSDIPLISAIGHETDFTLLDFVADLRAPTPTAAAEMAVPVLTDLKFTIKEHHNRINRSISRSIDLLKARLSVSHNRLPKLDDLIRYNEQKLDYAYEKLSNSFNLYIQKKIHKLSQLNLESRNLRIEHKINLYESKLIQLSDLLKQATIRYLCKQEDKLKSLSNLILSMDYKKVINRGFSVARDENDKILSKKEDFIKYFNLELSNGIIKAQIDTCKK